MFCEKCGAPMPDNAAFCERCGAPNNNMQNVNQGGYTQNGQNVNQGGYTQNGQNINMNNPTGGYNMNNMPQGNYQKGKNTLIPFFIIGILLLATAALAAAIVYFVKNGSSTAVDLNEFVKVEFSGYDSAGTATFSFDGDAFKKKYGSKIKYAKKSSNYDMTLLTLAYDSAADYIVDALAINFCDTKSGLSNGDTVEFVWKDPCEAIITDITNIKTLKHEKMTFTVEGLAPAEQSDPFENIKVRYTGSNGKGEIIIENNNHGDLGSLSFKADKNYMLSNGDKVTVSAFYDYGSLDDFCKEHGIVLTQTEKTYTVSGLSGTSYRPAPAAPTTITETTTETTTAAPAAQAPAPASNEYILPGSDSRYIARSELEVLNAEQCRLARNEIYARHGRRFKDQQLQAYFDSCSWYHGTIDPDNFSESVFNQYEKANKDLIVAYEKEKGYR